MGRLVSLRITDRLRRRIEAQAKLRSITFSDVARAAAASGLAAMIADEEGPDGPIREYHRSEPPPRSVPARRKQPPQFVYFIRSGEAIKIGKASGNVRDRMAQLQTANPADLELLGVMPGGLEEEAGLHRRFAHLRLRGEWFTCDQDLLDFIAGLPEIV
jgi:hypothetical protein